MSYFSKFPTIRYTFDSGNAVRSFLMTDIMRRVKADNVNVRNVLSYDEYDVLDGETPEIVADQLYGDPALHWIILISNEILDARWDWPLSNNSLNNYIETKYGAANINATHHYENSSGDTVYYRVYSGTVNLGAQGASSSISVTGVGTLFTTEIDNTGLVVRFGASTTAYTVVAINSNTSITVSGSAITGAISAGSMLDNNSYSSGTVTRITNSDYEFSVNESRRRIQILKPEFVPQFIENFQGLLSNGN